MEKARDHLVVTPWRVIQREVSTLGVVSGACNMRVHPPTWVSRAKLKDCEQEVLVDLQIIGALKSPAVSLVSPWMDAT